MAKTNYDDLSDEELDQLISYHKAKEAGTVNDWAKNYQPGEQEVEAAKETTGINYSAPTEFLLGGAKSIADTASALKQGAQFISGDVKGLEQSQIEQTEKNRLFDKYAGTAGMLGDLTGSIAQSVIPGVAAFKGAKLGGAALAGLTTNTTLRGIATSPVLQATVAGGLSGMVDAARKPLGEGETFLGNVKEGAKMGALFGGVFGLGSKALAQFSPTVRAKQKVLALQQQHLDGMEPEAQKIFMAAVGKQLDDGTRRKTAGQLAESKSLMDAELETLNQPSALQRWSQIGEEQQKEVLNNAKLIADNIKDKELLLKMDSSLLAGTLRDIAKSKAQTNSKGVYGKLVNRPVTPTEVKSLLDEDVREAMLAASKGGKEIPADVRRKLGEFINPPKSGLVDSKGKLIKDAPPDLNYHDLHEVYKYVKSSGEFGKETGNAVSNKLRMILSQDEAFEQGNKIYADILGPFSTIKKSGKILQNSLDKGNLFSPVNSEIKERGLALLRDTSDESRDTLSKVAGRRMISLVNEIGTPAASKHMVQELEKIIKYTTHDPLVNDIAKGLYSVISKPALKGKAAGASTTFGEVMNNVGSMVSSSFNMIGLGSGLFSKLGKDAYQRALVEVLTNPKVWAQELMDARSDPSKILTLLDKVKAVATSTSTNLSQQ